MDIIGIDPSVTATGICGVNGGTYTVGGSATKGADAWVNDERLRTIYGAVCDHARFADLAVIEDLPTHGMGAGKTGQSQGVCRLALLDVGVPYVSVTAATVKVLATGKGNATKADMRMELFKRTGLDVRDNNQADAWWLRQLGLVRSLDPDRLILPKTHLRALAAVRWINDTPVPLG